ncbi:hypothetical protein ACU4GD_17625 [Cupriavidus basilensis]
MAAAAGQGICRWRRSAGLRESRAKSACGGLPPTSTPRVRPEAPAPACRLLPRGTSMAPAAVG